MEMLGVAMAIALTEVAVVTDFYTYKIPNWLNQYGLMWWIIYYVTNLFFHRITIKDIVLELLAFICIFAGLFFVYAIGGLGAGDVKLLCVLGGFMGMKRLKMIIVLSFLFGAAYGILKILKERRVKMHRIHFSYAIFIAVIICAMTTLKIY